MSWLGPRRWREVYNIRIAPHLKAIECVQCRGQDCVDKGLLFIRFNDDGKLCNGRGNTRVMIQGSPKRAVPNVSTKVAIFDMVGTYELVELTESKSPREKILGIINLEGDTVKNIKRLSIQNIMFGQAPRAKYGKSRDTASLARACLKAPPEETPRL
ncbi:hypothetical protein M422DRAFT_251895 [Sphaerobolus stellatus SS14]|uniref:Uncharacterized protein n=1 Tax=Sphaerobolus stellatus (strain SS14) TaxID=990650 RepID=A0A0C9VC99_SPHS4|nr:hypothetical protein M422DRAFT_251895 [Sphaerobolus stellatus SS14]